MKISRALTAVIVLVIVATLAFVYGVPSGRRARREAVRVSRLARNAVGIYPLPVLTVRMWNGQRVALVEVYESGRLVASGNGERIERQLPHDVVETILERGKAALGDFSSRGCGTRRGGLNSELYLLVAGARVGSVCHDASGWPRGFETKRLLADIGSYVPGVFEAFGIDTPEASPLH